MAKKINKVLTTQAVPLTSEEVQNLGLTLSAVLERTILPTEALWIPNVTDVGILSWRLGTAGDPGPSDVNIRGAQGIQGPQGPQGPQGDQGEKGEQGEQGDIGPCPQINPATKNWMIYEDHTWKDTGEPSSGAVGPQGPKGDDGDKGDKGDKGETGPRGLGLSAEYQPITGGTQVSIWTESGTKEEFHFDVMDGKDISARSYPDQSNLGVQVEIWQKGEAAPDTSFLLESGYTPSAHVTPIASTEQHPAGGYNLQFMLPNGGSYGDSFNIWNGADGSMAGAPSIEGNRGISAEFLGDSKYVVGISGGYVDRLLVSSAQKSETTDLATSAISASIASGYYNPDNHKYLSIAEQIKILKDGDSELWNYLAGDRGDTPLSADYATYATSAYIDEHTASGFADIDRAINENKTAIQSKLSTVNRDATLSGNGADQPLGLINAYKQAIESVSGKVNAYAGAGSQNHDFLWRVDENGNGSWTEAKAWLNNGFSPVEGLSGYGYDADGNYCIGLNTSAMTHDKRYGWRKDFGWFADPIQWVYQIQGTYTQGGTNYQHITEDTQTLNLYKTMIHPAGTTSASSWANDNIIHIILEA